jgi:hypothetical protein
MRTDSPFPRNAGFKPVDQTPKRVGYCGCCGLFNGRGVKKELLDIAEEMRSTAATRACNDPYEDTRLTSWAGRIARALINGETMETAMATAIANNARNLLETADHTTDQTS